MCLKQQTTKTTTKNPQQNNKKKGSQISLADQAHSRRLDYPDIFAYMLINTVTASLTLNLKKRAR